MMAPVPDRVPPPGLPGLARETDRARAFADAGRAAATRRAYAADWACFAAWCAARNVDALPAAPAAVAVYLAWLADGGRTVSTIGRRLVALAARHRETGHHLDTRHPAIARTLKGIRRTLGTAPATKAAVTVEEVRALCAALPASLAGLRDRALLLVGFAGAFRRSELVALRRADLALRPEGLVVRLRRSKTDPDGVGRPVAIPRGRRADGCAVGALEVWLAAAGIEDGPLFRAIDRTGRIADRALSDRVVALVVKRAAAAAGLDATRYAGHSLRAGFATSAARAGADEHAIMRQTGHRSVQMVRRYIRDGDLFRTTAARFLDL
jgi:site-specific recombinase XerD